MTTQFTPEFIKEERRLISCGDLAWSKCAQETYPAALDEIERLRADLEAFEQVEGDDKETCVVMQREIERKNATIADLLKTCKAAESALRSYQYGNGSPDLAEEIADHIHTTIANAKGDQS
jgi:hypothetical protein